MRVKSPLLAPLKNRAASGLLTSLAASAKLTDYTILLSFFGCGCAVKYKVVILGGGVTGLAAAARSGREALLLEKEGEVGGLCRSFRVHGFSFDLAGHVLHFRTKRGRAFLEELMPGQLLWQARRASVFLAGGTVSYPFQRSLHELPARMRMECDLGLRGRSRSNHAPSNFLEWTLANFGEGIARHFMIPFNEKFWQCPLNALSQKWAARLVPLPAPTSREEQTGGGYNTVFAYPRDGGIAAVCKALRSRIASPVRRNAPCARIDLRRRKFHTRSGRSASYGTLVSTIPLPRLVAMIAGCPAPVREAARALQTLPVHCFYVAMPGPLSTADHWRYFPEKTISFFRVVFSSNISAAAAPAGMSSFIVEVSGSRSARDMKANLPRELADVGLTADRGVSVLRHLHVPSGYPIPMIGSAGAASEVRRFLSANGVVTAGRFGTWEHLSIEDSILDGLRAAEEARGKQ